MLTVNRRGAIANHVRDNKPTPDVCMGKPWLLSLHIAGAQHIKVSPAGQRESATQRQAVSLLSSVCSKAGLAGATFRRYAPITAIPMQA